MIFKSKLDTFVSQYTGLVQEKSLFLQKSFPSILALLLLGFLVGNVFGTFLNTLRFFFIWDGFIIFILIGVLEILSYTAYHAKNRSFIFLISPKIVRNAFWQFINFFKIGLMIGFFVDAFKVGS